MGWSGAETLKCKLWGKEAFHETTCTRHRSGVEVTPAEHWLELEAGVTPLFGRRSKEWNTDLVFGEPRSDSRHKASLVSCGYSEDQPSHKEAMG
jgi:hypothetical protein